MKSTQFRILLLIAFLFSCVQVQAQSRPTPVASRNPCHSTRRTTGDGQEACESYILPKKLCAKCRLKPWNRNNGKFFNCKSIYDVKSAPCVKQLRAYVNKNPCDKKRAQQIRNLNDAKNLDGLDYFLYAICEQCCDCIPMRAEISQYGSRKAMGTLFKEDRGNCPAHAKFDVCKVWPNVKAVGSKPEHVRGLPRDAVPVCPIFKKWDANIKQEGGWYNQPQVGIAPILREFLSNFTRSAGCSKKRAWTSCLKLESDQNRV